MTSVSNVGSSTATSSITAGSQLNQTDFLRLLTEQLKQQDPSDPQDSAQMAAQMAQFASSSGISEMNSSLKAIATQISDQTTLLQSIQAATTKTATQISTFSTQGA